MFTVLLTSVTALPVHATPDEPAVIVPPEVVEVYEQPWTARFLIPLLVVTAIVLLVGVAVSYNRSVRKRYKVVS